MREFYHYTLETKLSEIQSTGIFPNHPYFTTTEYYNAQQAGHDLGVRAHYIDCVLKFQDDGLYRRCADVANGHSPGGGVQYSHPFRPKPIAIRKISDRVWRKLG